MRRLRRRICRAAGTLLIVLGFALLLTSCARRAPPPPAPIILAPAGPAKIYPPSARAPVPLPRRRPAALPAAPDKPVPQARSAPAVPAKAQRYAPMLVAKQRALWPSAPAAHTLAGLVEQESCVSLTSSRCWDPRAELKTPREYGFGLGQITIAYRADGTVCFNKFEELRTNHASLRAWRWENRYDPGYQLTAIVEMVHGLWRRVPPAADADAHWAFALNSYNGGLGGLLQDRQLCQHTAGCDPRRWFDNIETHSLKSRAPQPGYAGRSWYEISRGYVRNVLTVRRAKYVQFWEER